jgi:branched-chain amino acid transport system substrate-binding protein
MDLSEYFIKQYIALGGEILWVGDFIENMSDFSFLLSGVKELNPDVIYLPAYVRDSGFIIRQAREMGISSVFLGGDGWGSEIFEYGLDDVNGSYLTDHWYYELDRNNSMEFVRKFEDKFNTRPSSGSALTYDAISILLYAIEQAGTFDPETIRQHLAIIEDFIGITGDISFDENGNPIKSAVILKLENNERVFVKYIEP